MPFDGTNLGAPSLRTLADALRDRSRWPKGLPDWDYARPNSCALGLAARLWPGRIVTIGDARAAFGLSKDERNQLFLRTRLYWLPPFKRLVDWQPEHVADAIEKYLSRTQAS
jgi:hypothetical protein